MLHRSLAFALGSALALGTLLAVPASAGSRHPVVVYAEPTPPWYAQPPHIGTGPGHYYRYHNYHVPSYPHRLSGYPVPLYRLDRPVDTVAVVAERPSAHVAWCSARYRSYSVHSDTFQPYDGPRCRCRSPYR